MTNDEGMTKSEVRHAPSDDSFWDNGKYLSAKNQRQNAFTIWKNERPDLAKQLSILRRQFH